MLRTSLHHVLTDSSDQPLADRLGELGWSDVVDQDEPTALQTLFEIKGETLSAADALGPTLAGTSRRRSPATHASPHATVALRSPFGDQRHRRRHRHGRGGRARRRPAELIVVPQSTAGSRSAPPPASRSRRSAAPTRRSACCASPAAWPPATSSGSTATRGRSSVARARWLLAAELVGISRHVVATAVEYTKERVQYGKPIGVFQALQHRLASAHAMTVGAGHLVTEAGLDGDALDRDGREVHGRPDRRARLHPGAAVLRRDRVHVGARVPPLPAPHVRPRPHVRRLAHARARDRQRVSRRRARSPRIGTL